MKTFCTIIWIIIGVGMISTAHSQKTAGTIKDLSGTWSYELDNHQYFMIAAKTPGGYTFRRTDCQDKFFVVDWQDGNRTLTGNYQGVSFDSTEFTMPAAAMTCPTHYPACAPHDLRCLICVQRGFISPARFEIADDESLALRSYQRLWHVRLLYNCEETRRADSTICNDGHLAADCCEAYLDEEFTLICTLHKK